MSLRQKIFAEFLGTTGLLIVVVGSGIMGESLAQGNAALALLANSLATGAGLYALIQTFGSFSGAHFNPAVSLVEWLWRRLDRQELVLYVAAQTAGAVLGICIAHAMFGLDILQYSTHDRGEARFVFSEVIATAGLVFVIALSGKRIVGATPAPVALYITSAYWCTSSTSFANPAVTLARSLTATFTGIQATAVPMFVVAQLTGALLAFGLTKRFMNDASADFERP